MREDDLMPLTLDDVEDLIDSWEFDPRVDTVAAATELVSSMGTDDPGRTDLLQVIADHQSMRGDVDAALATLSRMGPMSEEERDIVQAMRITFLLEAGRDAEAEAELALLRRRGTLLPSEAIERVAEALEELGRLREAMRWFTIGLRDLDPQDDLPDHREESALIGRWRVRRALDLPPDHYDELARVTLDLRQAR